MHRRSDINQSAHIHPSILLISKDRR